MKTHSKNIDFKELAEQYSVQIEGWHLFYESFIENDFSLSIARGILFEMQSEIVKASLKNKENPKINEAQKRIDDLSLCIDKFEGLNSRCMSLQRKLKQSVSKSLQLEEENKRLINELEAVKKAHNEQT